MKNINTKLTSALIILMMLSVLISVSCDKNGISEDKYQIQYQREAQLVNTYTNGITPLNEAFVVATKTLKNNITNFKQETTIQNLETAQNQWIEIIKTWKRLELYNLGPIEDSFIHFEINRWATDTENINSFIDGSEVINETFIASKGSSSKGISALEYLLFSSDSNADVLLSFTTNSNFENRLDYLLALSENLHTKANNLDSIWTGYQSDFVALLENGISGSQSQLTNAMITLIEEIIISKLGNPLGDTTGGIIETEDLEAYRSKTSLLIIQEHLTALKRCYKGGFIDDSIKWGYDDYLKLIGNENLDIEITNAFDVCQEKIDMIPNSLYVELQNNPENIIRLRIAFTDLLVLIKVDMANAIGTTVTINDNDGD